MKNKLVYVAHPYYHDNPFVIIDRYDAVSEVCYMLLARGVCAVSPVMQWHPVAKVLNLKNCDKLISDSNKLLLSKCDMVLVLMLNGWQESKGVRDEVVWAREAGIPVRYVTEKDIVLNLEGTNEENKKRS